MVQARTPPRDESGSLTALTRHLLARVQSGDAAALEQLCDRYATLLLPWLEARLHPHAGQPQRPMKLLGDVLHDTLPAIAPSAAAEVWDRVRSGLLERLRNAEALAVDPPAVRRAPPTASVSAEEAAVGLDVVRRYDAALLRLRPEERLALVLRLEIGCGYDEIAAALERPSEGAARMAVCRAMVHLAEEMTRDRG
jgi:hypothetical protein